MHDGAKVPTSLQSLLRDDHEDLRERCNAEGVVDAEPDAECPLRLSRVEREGHHRLGREEGQGVGRAAVEAPDVGGVQGVAGARGEDVRARGEALLAQVQSRTAWARATGPRPLRRARAGPVADAILELVGSSLHAARGAPAPLSLL